MKSDLSSLTSLHRASYGSWAGNGRGNAPVPERCCVEVSDGNFRGHYHQCSRKRGFGPEQAYCKQHDPAAIAEKDRVRNEKYRAALARERPKWFAAKMLSALKEIAEGHNDPRSLARSLVEQIEAES